MTTISTLQDVALPKGSLIVVSGANGNIASHVIDQLLKAGYRARGTVRNAAKQQWLLEHFDKAYGSGKIELIEVPDMAAPNAFDEAVKGAAGFIHTATPVMESEDPNVSIPVVVQGTINFLESAAKEPGMKRVVLTSSSGACTAPKPNKKFAIDSSTWNEEAVENAYKPPPYEGLERRLNVYYAGKTKGEQAAWQWVKEHNPQFVLNTVLPNANFGPILDPEHQQYHSTLLWIKALFEGYDGKGWEGAPPELAGQPPQYYINIQDNAIGHVAALIFDDVKGERLFTFAYPYTYNEILAIFRKMYPERKFLEDQPDAGRDLSTVTNQRAEELVKRIKGSGWTNLEDTIKDSVKYYA